MSASYGHPWAAPDTPMPEPRHPTRPELLAEVRRLRDALDKIANGAPPFGATGDEWAVSVARNALGDES